MNDSRSLCPLCGQPNDCAVERGDDPKTCWCMTTSVPLELRRRAQEARAAGERPFACICKRCVEQYREGK